MDTKSFALVRDRDGWAFTGPGELSQTYKSREAALMGVVSAIAIAMTEGDEIELKIPRVMAPSVEQGAS